MKKRALEALRGGRDNVNPENKYYPDKRYLGINTNELHIKIYKLIDEYVGLYEDLQKISTQSAKGYISERMRAIERELVDFWIVPDSEMITPTK